MMKNSKNYHTKIEKILRSWWFWLVTPLLIFTIALIVNFGMYDPGGHLLSISVGIFIFPFMLWSGLGLTPIWEANFYKFLVLLLYIPYISYYIIIFTKLNKFKSKYLILLLIIMLLVVAFGVKGCITELQKGIMH